MSHSVPPEEQGRYGLRARPQAWIPGQTIGHCEKYTSRCGQYILSLWRGLLSPNHSLPSQDKESLMRTSWSLSELAWTDCRPALTLGSSVETAKDPKASLQRGPWRRRMPEPWTGQCREPGCERQEKRHSGPRSEMSGQRRAWKDRIRAPAGDSPAPGYSLGRRGPDETYTKLVVSHRGGHCPCSSGLRG